MQGVRILAVDEISIRKGYKYLTIVIDFETLRILWTNKDRLSINHNLSVTYMNDSLKQSWDYRCQDNLRRHLLEWVDLAIESGIKRLIKFAKKLLRYGYGYNQSCYLPYSKQ